MIDSQEYVTSDDSIFRVDISDPYVKSITRLNSVLKQFQLKEESNIPVDVISYIANSHRLKNGPDCDLTYEYVKDVLTEKGLYQYYDSIYDIIYQITGKKAKIASETIHTIQSLFQEIIHNRNNR